MKIFTIITLIICCASSSYAGKKAYDPSPDVAASSVNFPSEIFRKAERLGGRERQNWYASSAGFKTPSWKNNGRVYHLIITWDGTIKECSYEKAFWSSPPEICHMLDD